MQHFNEDFVSIISTLHVSALIGHLQVLTVLLFIYANILKVMAIGYFLYQPKLHVAIVVRYIQNMLKTSINYFKMSKMYGSVSQNMLKYNFC
jgi:hypothetical protein